MSAAFKIIGHCTGISNCHLSSFVAVSDSVALFIVGEHFILIFQTSEFFFAFHNYKNIPNKIILAFAHLNLKMPSILFLPWLSIILFSSSSFSPWNCFTSFSSDAMYSSSFASSTEILCYNSL